MPRGLPGRLPGGPTCGRSAGENRGVSSGLAAAAPRPSLRAGSSALRFDSVIKTAFTELLRIQHPIALAGMGGGTSPELVAAVSNAGGLGIMGATDVEAEKLPG